MVERPGRMRSLQQVYAGRLEHSYSLVAAHALAASTALVSGKASQLLSLGSDLPESLLAPIRHVAALSSARSGRAADAASVAGGCSQLRETAQAAVTYLQQTAGNIEASVFRYDQVCEEYARHAASLEFPAEELDSRVDGYANEVRQRCQSLGELLAENRYDAAVFRRLLVEDVLVQAKLGAFIGSTVENHHRRLHRAWQGAAGAVGLTVPELNSPVFAEPDLLVASFLEPVQLFYERPSVFWGMLQALGRGRFQEKLNAEVSEGLAAMAKVISGMLEQQWKAEVGRWHAAASGAALAWLRGAAGADRHTCMARAAALREQAQAITKWAKDLGDISVRTTLDGWRAAVCNGALRRMAKRVRQEQRQG